MTQLPDLIALHLSLYALWLEMWGIQPAPILRAAAQALEDSARA